MPPVPQDQQFMNQFGRPDGPHQFFFGFHGGFLMMVFVLALLALGVLVLSALRRRHHEGHAHPWAAGPRRSEALRVLDERLARGEIDPDDYRVRRDLLGGERRVTTSA